MFSDVLKYLRKREHMTQQELANKLKISRGAVSMYELGQREPDFETLEAIADCFNVSMSVLLGKDEAVKPPAPYLTDLQKKYNALDDHGRGLVDLVLDVEYRRCTAPIQEPEKIVYIRHYLVPAAAGYASPIVGEEYEEIPLPEDAPAGAKTAAGIGRTVTVSPKIQKYVTEAAQNAAGALIRDPDGKAYKLKDWTENVFYAVLEAAGIDNPMVTVGGGAKRHKYTPHSCRHTFATLLKRAAGSEKDKIELIGHASGEQLRYYQDVELDDLRKLTDQL